MPDPSTTRLGMYKSKSDGSEDVNYTTDIGQNLDKLDAAVGYQIVTSSTRPSTPYPGKPITESDTGYRTYFSNGTSPASGSWVEIPNSSGTFGGDLDLSSSSTLSIGAATLSRTAGGSLSTNTNFQSQRTVVGDVALSALLTGDTFDRARIYADGKLELGPGNAARDTTLARTATGRLALTGTNAALTIGSATYRNALSSGPTTVANTVTETVIATATIPASDAVAGAIYRMTAYGVASSTGTPNFTITARLGGAAGTSMASIGASATASGISGRPWHAVYYLRCVSTGASAAWSPTFVVYHSLTTAAQTGNNIQLPNSTANQTVDSTVSQAMVLTWTWGTASSSNTATCTGVVFERVA